MAFNSIFRRASCSVSLRRRYEREICVDKVGNSSLCGVVGGQLRSYLRFLTGSVDKTASPKKVAGEISLDGGLPFVLNDGPLNGTSTLIKKGQDEIIHIDVIRYQNFLDYYDDESILACDDDTTPHGSQKKIDSDKLKNPDQVVDVNPCLLLVVKIFYGYMYRKCIMFDVITFPDSPEKILIRSMRASVHSDDGYLDDCEDFIKIKGIKPSRFNHLFDSPEETESESDLDI